MTKHKRAQIKLDKACDAVWEAVQAVADTGRYGISATVHRLHEELVEVTEAWSDGKTLEEECAEYDSTVAPARAKERLRKAIQEARAHLGAAMIQSIPSDDQIIIEHVRDAHCILCECVKEPKS